MTSPISHPPESVSALPPHQTNQQWWDEVTPVHLRSDFYDVASFLNGECRLDSLELTGLGPLPGKSVLHLQCHFGMSTIELVRQGAARAVGVDFSPVAITAARDLAEQTGTADCVSFIGCDVLELERHLDERFDIVFASYGVLTWISDLARWAKVAARFLKPGGCFFLAEIHPTSMLFDNDKEERVVKYGYFHDPAGLQLGDDPDYSDPSFKPTTSTREWQWSLSDIFKAVTDAGLNITEFAEYPYSCYAQFPDLTKQPDGFYHPPADQPKVPLLFAVEAKQD
ncbi:class I SAM-dependent methyltransferase [bacterium]|nr:class I SAM-dependent methyltransferase [bacterium]